MVELGLEGSKDKFNNYLKEIEKLEDSHFYVQGTLKTNKTYNRVRVYNYINHINRLNEREGIQDGFTRFRVKDNGWVNQFNEFSVSITIWIRGNANGWVIIINKFNIDIYNRIN